MAMTLLYTSQYLLVAEGKRDESTPTTTAVDEIEEEPATTQQMVKVSERAAIGSTRNCCRGYRG
jgi:hypothetical protein